MRGVNGSRCIAVVAQQDVDVMLGQKITGLDPTKPYKATARIKTEGIAQGKGGNICLDYLWAPSSEGVTGTKDWTSVTLEIDEIPADGSIVLCMRMGNTANSSQGVAYFDNISLKENTDLYIRESEHIRLMVDKKYVSISDSQIDEWLLKLDKVYEAYIELFSGRKPFEGKIVTLRSAAIDAWAYAGNPVQWNQDYISSALLNVGKGDWCFGIMHELGHNFAPYISNATYTFDWNEELFANFHVLCVGETQCRRDYGCQYPATRRFYEDRNQNLCRRGSQATLQIGNNELLRPYDRSQQSSRNGQCTVL